MHIECSITKFALFMLRVCIHKANTSTHTFNSTFAHFWLEIQVKWNEILPKCNTHSHSRRKHIRVDKNPINNTKYTKPKAERKREKFFESTVNEWDSCMGFEADFNIFIIKLKPYDWNEKNERLSADASENESERENYSIKMRTKQFPWSWL